MRKSQTAVYLLMISFALGFVVFGQNEFSQFGLHTKSLVKIRRAEAFSDGKGVWIHWQTEEESGNLGFNIFRISHNETVRVNPNMIGGALLFSQIEAGLGRQYSFFDTEGTNGDAYFIENYGLNGEHRHLISFTAQYIADLTKVAGVSSSFLRDAVETAQSEKIETELQLPPDIFEKTNLSPRASADQTAQQWIAGQPGVKIGVRKNGLYRVTRSELENAGFEVNTNPNSWQLYLDGVEQSISVEQSGNYIEFYGRTIDTALTNTRIYYLLSGTQNGRRIGTKIIRPISGNVVGRTYNQTFRKSEQLYYVGDYLNGEEENFFGTFVSATGTNINFNLSGTNPANDLTNLTVRLGGLSSTNHLISVSFNGNLLGQMSWSGKTVKSHTFSIPLNFLLEGSNTLNLRTLNGAGDVTLFESVKVDFPRKYAVQENELSFYTNNNRVTNVTGFTTPNVRLFDVTHPDTPSFITNVSALPNGGGFDLRVPANRTYVMYAVEASAVLQAATIVRNFPSTISTPVNGADLIIITHADLSAQANDWAAYRAANDGFSVKVVDIEDIYDEYSFGLMSSKAIRDFLQYAKTNWQIQPNYVMLLGDASNDPKNYLGNGYFNQVPTQMVDTVYIETGSDESLADFNADGLAELSIGRISARTPQEAANIFNKTVQFEANTAASFERGFLFVSDLPDSYDYQAASNRLRAQLPSGTKSTMIFRGDSGSRSQLLSQWNAGKYLINWTGHGTTGLWGVSSFFNSNDILPLTNSNYTILTTLTCLNGYFLDPVFSGLSEVAVKTPNKAAIASWGSTGLTTPDIQEIMAIRFFNKIGAGSVPRLGDLIRDAKTQIPAGRDVRLSWALIGDPALKVSRSVAPDRQENLVENKILRRK